MNFRLVNTPAKGAKPRGLVVLFLVGSQVDKALRAALPGFVVVASDTYSVSPTSGDLALARRVGKVDADLPVFLVGYSAGCQTVRAMLVSNIVRAENLLGVAVFDGSHAAVPPAPWQIQVWKDALDRALKGPSIFIGTATCMSYVKRIPEGKPGRATPTREVLEEVVGRKLEVGVSLRTEDGRVHVELFDSPEEPTKEAAAAHGRQQTEVMPRLLGWVLSGQEPKDQDKAPEPVTDSSSGPPGDSAGAPSPGPRTEVRVEEYAAKGTQGGDWRDPTLDFGVRSVLWMLQEQADGVKEKPVGSNDDGPSGRIRQYSTGISYTRKDPKTGAEKKLATTKDDWCAKSISFSHFAVAHEGESYPPHRVSGIEMQQDAQGRDAWIPIADVRERRSAPQLGDVAMFKRGTEGWQRHVCKARTLRADGSFVTIGGNEANGYKETERTIWDADLLGFVRVDPALWGPAVS